MLARSAFKPRRQNAPRLAAKSAPGYLKWIRGRGCVVCIVRGHLFSPDTAPRVEAAHVDYAGGKGVGTKVADRFAVPLCGSLTGHHAEQHRIGWKSFEARHAINALDLANEFWREWPGRRAWEAKNA